MDKRHIKLVKDLENLLEEAKAFEFHDFKNDKYAAPKMELVGFLLAMVDKVKEGGYDN